MAVSKKTKRLLWIGGIVAVAAAGAVFRKRIPLLKRLFVPKVAATRREEGPSALRGIF